MNNIKQKLATAEISYRNKFQCVGSDCNLTCCAGWNVHIDKDTYYKYKSDPLIFKHVSKLKGENVSRTSNTFAKINLKDNGDCPLLDENMLCNVQKNLGEKALSKTCSQFPRQDYVINNIQTKALTLGCPEVVKLAVFDDSPTEVVASVDITTSESSIATAQALINFLKDSSRPSWQKLLVISSTMKVADQKTRLNYFKLSEVLRNIEANLGDSTIDNNSIFQVETLYPVIAVDRLEKQRITLSNIKQNSRLYIDQNGPNLEQRVKKYVLASELFKLTEAGGNYSWLDKTVANEIFKMHSKLGGDSAVAQETVTEIILISAMANFFTILNFGYNDFKVSKDDFANTIALIYRKLGHNDGHLQLIKKQLISKYSDHHSSSCLLLA